MPIRHRAHFFLARLQPRAAFAILSKMFNEAVLDHFRDPRNAGELPGATATVEVSSPRKETALPRFGLRQLLRPAEDVTADGIADLDRGGSTGQLSGIAAGRENDRERLR